MARQILEPDRLVEARASLGWSQDKLAAALSTPKVKVSQSAVSEWERGDSRPHRTRLLRLASVVGRSVPWLCGEDASAPAGSPAPSAPVASVEATLARARTEARPLAKVLPHVPPATLDDALRLLAGLEISLGGGYAALAKVGPTTRAPARLADASVPASPLERSAELPILRVRPGGIGGRTFDGLAAGLGASPLVSPELMMVDGYEDDPDVYVFRVAGESMTPTILDDDPVAVRAYPSVLELGPMEEAPANPDEIVRQLGAASCLVVASVDDDFWTVKRLHVMRKRPQAPGRFRLDLTADNRDWGINNGYPKVLTRNQTMRVFGRVFAIGKEWMDDAVGRRGIGQ